MDSSLSPPPPSDDGPFEAVGPSPARPVPPFETRSYMAMEEMYAESSTAHLKRPRVQVSSSSVTSSPHDRKRFREPTPLYEELGEGTSAINNEEVVESSACATPVDAMIEIGEDPPRIRIDPERRVEKRLKSSEHDEPSVLFSEQVGTKTEPTEAMEAMDGETVDEQAVPLEEDVSPEEATPEDDSEDATAVQEPSPSSSYASDTDGAEHFHQWNERYAEDAQLSSSDGEEDLDDYMEPVWAEYEDFMPDDDATDHYRRYNRKVARSRKHRHTTWTDSGDGRVYVERKPRTTREVFEENLMEGVEMQSYHSGDSDDFLMEHRPPLDRAGVKRDIRAFTDSIEVLSEAAGSKRDYQVIDRLGEGTFSSVYLAYDRRHGKYHNQYWTNRPDSTKRSHYQSRRHEVKLALKRILATSSPTRIENELEILESLRGCRNVSQLVTAFRQEDQIVIVLPFHQSDDFRHFYKHIDGARIRSYMRCLLRALADTHSRGIVHRDVKPANFLFDYETGDGVLCDFGLAERYKPPARPTCQHAPGTLESLGGTRTKTTDTPLVEQAVYDARKRSKLGEGRIGFPQDDKRSAIKTNRAGTRGFRAPEVLLKCPDQTVAIDIWSAGVMLLSLLTHKFPVFNSSDDIEALMEIAAMFGRGAMEKCAMLHNRTIMTNVPSVDQAPANLNDLVLKLNPHLYTPPLADPTPEEAAEHITLMDNALDLCSKLLKLDSARRIAAKDALNHNFFNDFDDIEASVERVVPILSGEDGKCGHLHSTADGKHRAYIYQDCQEMAFGQGIPVTRDKLCPVHLHWQQRTLLNPLSACRNFVNHDPDKQQDEEEEEEEDTGESPQDEEEEQGEQEDEDELEVMPPVLGERDNNVDPVRLEQKV